MENNVLIEKFLKDELSPAEIVEMESLAKSDANFAQELSFQKELVSSIKKARANQLKARLNKIEVASTNSSNTYLKVAAAVVLLTGFVLLFLWKNDSEKTVVVSETKVEAVENNVVNNTTVTENVKQEEVVVAKNTTKSAPKTEILASGEVPATPEDLMTNESVSDRIITDNTENDLSKKVDIDRKMVGVNVNNTTAYKSHYQYTGKEVMLYGDFASKKYELIQYNSSNKTQLYIYIAERFYEIDITKNTILPLVEITNPEKVRELRQRM